MKTKYNALIDMGLKRQLPSPFSPLSEGSSLLPSMQTALSFTLCYTDSSICSCYTCPSLHTVEQLAVALPTVNHRSIRSFFGEIHELDNLTGSYPVNQLVALDHNSIPCPTKGWGDIRANVHPWESSTFVVRPTWVSIYSSAYLFTVWLEKTAYLPWDSTMKMGTK